MGTGIIAKGYKANRHRFINFLGVLFQGAKSTFDKKKSAKEGEIFMEQPDKDAALKVYIVIIQKVRSGIYKKIPS